jgi:hypothetical protein
MTDEDISERHDHINSLIFEVLHEERLRGCSIKMENKIVKISRKT